MCNIYVKYTTINLFNTFHFYLKVPLKNIKRVIPEEDVFDMIHKYHHKYHNIINDHSSSKETYHQISLHGIFVYLFCKFFSINVRSDSDSEHQRTSWLWLYNNIDISIYIYFIVACRT